MSSPHVFVATSDLHFTGPGIDELTHYKKDNLVLLEKIEQVRKSQGKSRPKALLVAGDVTDNGTDDLWPPKKPTWPLVPLPFSDKPNEFLGYRRWREKASQYVDNYFSCRGNHDSYLPSPGWWRPFDYDQLLHNCGYYYAEKLFDDIHLVVLGKEPYDKLLGQYIPERLKNLKGKRVILMFHYNLEDPNGAEWSKFFEKKKEFEEAIRPFRDRIIMIVTGHSHINHFGFWKPDWIADDEYQGYPYTIVGGRGLTFFSFTTGDIIPWFISDPHELTATNGRTGETRKLLEL